MSINHHELASAFLKGRVRDGTRTLQAYQGEFWEWNGKVYVALPKVKLRHQLLIYLQSTVGISEPRVADDVFTWVEALLSQQVIPRQPCWLPGNAEEGGSLFTAEELGHEWVLLKNGLLDLTRTAGGHPTLISVTPRWFSSMMIPVPWDDSSGCPLWSRSISQWMCDDPELVAFLQEFVGYCLVPDTSHDLALFLEGEGSNGKTTFSEVVEALVGRENTSAVPLEHWGSPFALGDTLGKLVNFASETDGKGVLPANRLKSYISGDSFTFQRKYMTGITANPTARLIISWNRRPRVSDESDGFWRRVQLVPWRARFSRGTRDEYLTSKLLLELPGILRWAVEGLCRLRRVGKFTEPHAVASVTDSYRREADPVRCFTREMLEASDSGLLAKDAAYETFRSWCDDLDITPVDRSVFCKGVLRLLPTVGVVRVRTPVGRIQSFSGMGWTHAGLQLQGDR